MERCGGASGMHGGRPRLSRGGPDSGLGGQGEHPEHGAHVRDLGGVSKVLSGWLNTFAPCRVEEGAYTMQSEVRAGRREGVEQ